MAQLLAVKFKDTSGTDVPKPESKSRFNSLYGDLGDLASDETIAQYYANFRALKFLKNIQGAGNDLYRISEEKNDYCRKANIIIVNKETKEVEELLSTFILGNYEIKDIELIKRRFRDNTIGLKRGELYELVKHSKYFGVNSLGNEYMYSIKEVDEVAILPFWDATQETVTIPSSLTIQGKIYKVTGILPRAFFGSKRLKKVKFEEIFANLDIGNEAFYACEGFEIFEIQDAHSLTTLNIGEKAFKDCKRFKVFEIPQSATSLTALKIKTKAFQGCTGFENFKISENVTELNIWTKAFQGCTGLKEFRFTSRLIRLHIGKSTFKGCTELENFKIPDSVADLNISTKAFKGCIRLTLFEIPKSVNNIIIHIFAFSGCTSLTNFVIPAEGITTLWLGASVFANTGLKEFILPNSLIMENPCRIVKRLKSDLNELTVFIPSKFKHRIFVYDLHFYIADNSLVEQVFGDYLKTRLLDTIVDIYNSNHTNREVENIQDIDAEDVISILSTMKSSAKFRNEKFTQILNKDIIYTT